MIKRHGPALFVSLASCGPSAVSAAAQGFAVLSFIAAFAFGSESTALARPKAELAAAAAAGGVTESAQPPSCRLARFAAGRVETVIDGRTFVLDDGRAIRLAAIEVAPLAALPEEQRTPRAEPAGPPTAAPAHPLSAGETARRMLAALVSGRDVVLKYAEAMPPPVDRYDHFVGYGFVTDGTAERSLQEVLLASGAAQLAPQVEPAACRPALRAREDEARRAARGLWADPRHAVHDAADPTEIRPRRGRFAVIAGEVVSVRDSGGTIYVNFSRRWSEGFSAYIRQRNAARFAAAGYDLKRLTGRRVELRGFVEARRGLLMAIEQPEQIAIVDGKPPARP